jgi:hypothetical protein
MNMTNKSRICKWTWQINIVSVGASVFLQRYFAWIILFSQWLLLLLLVLNNKGIIYNKIIIMNDKIIIEFGLRKISELFRPRSALSASTSLRQITLTSVWIILISCSPSSNNSLVSRAHTWRVDTTCWSNMWAVVCNFVQKIYWFNY